MVKRYFILLVALLLYVVTQAQERVWNSAFLKNESPHTLYSFQAGMSWMKFDDTFGVKGKLAVGVCSFTDEPADADWVIRVDVSAREYSNVNVGNLKSYFSYVDAQIVIDKVLTSQRIYEDEISLKGGHTFGYVEAAQAGYKEIGQKISKIIKENIK